MCKYVWNDINFSRFIGQFVFNPINVITNSCFAADALIFESCYQIYLAWIKRYIVCK